MHSTGSLVVQPPGTELASRMSGVAPARRRPAAVVVPAVGWLVTMNALQVAGVSVAVSDVSNHTCRGAEHVRRVHRYEISKRHAASY